MPDDRSVRADSALSYARRIGEDIHVVVHLRKAPFRSPAVRLRFAARHAHLDWAATATRQAQGWVLEALVPASKLEPHVWDLAVEHDGDAAFLPLGARLLVGRKQPVALLVGSPREARSIERRARQTEWDQATFRQRLRSRLRRLPPLLSR